MDQNFKQWTSFLVGLGTEDVPHTHKTYLAHLIGVYRDLEKWGADAELCRAGLFHSIYGTQRFQKFALPLERRDEVVALIGQRAERLAFLNCFMDRDTFDRATFQTEGPYRIRNRVTGEEYDLPRQEFDDLCRVHLCDWLEQVPRTREWDYRRAAYRQMAERLDGVALQAYDRVFEQETAGTNPTPAVS